MAKNTFSFSRFIIPFRAGQIKNFFSTPIALGLIEFNENDNLKDLKWVILAKRRT